MFGFSTIGVIRGERAEPLNWSLSYATAQGMELTYLDRETYRHKHEPRVLDALRVRFGNVYVLPEGGSNALAVRGCAELPQEIDTEFDLICCSVGSGGTLAGIAAGLAPGQHALGFSSLKGAWSLDAEVAELQHDAFGTTSGNWTINHDFHCGGFVKRTPELDKFISDFHRRHGVDLDWVYVAKMLYGLVALAERGEFDSGTTIVAVITGAAEPAATP